MRKSFYKMLITIFISLVTVAIIVFLVKDLDQNRIDKGGNKPQTQTGTTGPKLTEEGDQNQIGEVKQQGSNKESSKNISFNLKHPLVVFTFDDGNESDYLLAYPILKKYGIEGTSYVNPNNPDHNVKYKLSWNEIYQMYNNGWNFGDHTYTHINLDKSTPDEIKRSMEEDNRSFLRSGLPLPDVFAYPYGILNNENESIISQYRKQARLAYYKDDLVNLSNVNPYEIPCVSADMQTPRLLLEHEKVVDKASMQNGVIVFRVHCMYRNKKGDTGEQPVETNSNLFAQLVDYCVKKGCDFTTMDGLMQLYTNGTITKPQPSQKVSDVLQTSWQESDASDKYIFYSTGNGLYRTNLDGSAKTLLQSGQFLKLAGVSGNWVYFTDNSGKLCRISVDGGQAAKLSDTPVSGVAIVSGNVYCIQEGEICLLKADGTVANIMPIPEKLLTEPKCLKTDGSSLYLCIYYQQGLCDIYKCDTDHGNVALIKGTENDDPLILKDGYAIVYDGNEVNKLNIQTGQKQGLFSCSGELLDMTSYNDWILYITKPFNEDKTNINGYNLVTGKTFEVESKGDYFYQTLQSEIILCDSEHNDALSILTINGVKASFASLAT